jgi:8-oxo-dGTP pyrophosphatase MutT (NUDIX family)
MRTVNELSAGGVALAFDPLRVAIVSARARNGSVRWVLPKGLVDKGETVEAAALREVREETGFEVELIEPGGDVEYWFVLDGARHHKRVRFYVMRVTGGDPSLHDAEVEEVALVDPREALARMTHEDERRVVRQALSKVSQS